MNKPSFDVSKEPCIPVIRNGELEYVSLRDALVNAHEYLEIQNPLLTVEFGLYRLLIALMGDIFFVEQGKSLNTVYLGELLKQGKFDASRIDKYFAKYAGTEENRFDLFSETHPFIQTANMSGKDKSLAGLFHPLPSGTNSTHFHHGSEEDFVVSPMAGLWLLSTIAPFMTAGGAGLSPSINGAPPIYVLIRGTNLFQTLCLNFCTVPLDVEPLANDIPAWRSNRAAGSERAGSGYLEALTWRPRQVQFKPDRSGRCSITGNQTPILIRVMKFIAGDSTRFDWRDPNCAYRFTDDGAIICRVREGRVLWRDTAPLTLQKKERKIAARPKVLDQLEKLHLKQDEIQIQLFGLRTDMKMKIFEWQREKLTLPMSLLQNAVVFEEEIQLWLSQAESSAFSFRIAIKNAYPRDGQGNKSAFQTRIDYSERLYWNKIRQDFDGLIRQLSKLETSNIEIRQPLREQWRKTLERQARAAFETAANDLDINNHALERIVRARRGLEIGLKRVFDPKPPSGDKKPKAQKSKKEDS
jgi:CRISPR system Cascade subunit CasA